MKKYIIVLSLSLCFVYSVAQDHQTVFSQAQEYYANGDYENCLRMLASLEQQMGANARIESLRIYALRDQGLVKETFLSIERYLYLTRGSALHNNEAHQGILSLHESLKEQLLTEKKRKLQALEQQRLKEADAFANQAQKIQEQRTGEVKAEKKAEWRRLLSDNASENLSRQLGDARSLLNDMGLSVSQYTTAKKTYANGDIYRGELKEGNPHGKGTMEYSDGGVYKGTWVDGAREGQGTYTKGSEEYEGHWNDGQRNGYGTQRYASGTVYAGQWHNNKQHGLGKRTALDGNYFEGTFENNEPVTGKIKTALIDGSRYEGDFTNGYCTGKGTISYSNGDIYTGEVADGRKHGLGTLRMVKRSYYSGTWENDIKKNVRKHYYQKVRLGAGYIGLTYIGLQDIAKDKIPSRHYTNATLDFGYMGRWWNGGMEFGYFKMPEFSYEDINVAETKRYSYGNIYVGANLGPAIALFKDHVILKANYHIGYFPGNAREAPVAFYENYLLLPGL